MAKVIIVGSGASGVHFALTVLQKGHEVLMLDVGHRQPEIPNPDDNLNQLKANLADPAQYFLGENYEAVIYPDYDSEYYGFPPSKKYVFTNPPGFKSQSNGFSPLYSFAQGGLAEAWTGGVYPLNDHELSDFPFSYSDIEPYYVEVADRIGITGTEDDLAKFYPVHQNLMPPLELDQHSERLLAAYEKQRSYLNHKLGCFLGRSRMATLSRDKGMRKACNYTGRCIWGCPSQSLYTPSITLDQCKEYPKFKYISGMYVSHFNNDSRGLIESVVIKSLPTGGLKAFAADRFVLAAGTLSSSKIFMNTIYKKTGEVIKLDGLMDNRQILIPFLNLKMIGATYNPRSYQYHQLAMGIENGNPQEYIHGQITTLKTALLHPIIQNFPFDLHNSILLFRNLRAALGVVNINFDDHRRQGNYLTLKINGKAEKTELVLNYRARADEEALLKRTIKITKRTLFKLGCLVPPGTIHVRPMGSSVHYAGTIPMSTRKINYTVSEYCQSNDFPNLYIVDGTTFPFLPAKNLTFTLMANAVRVAETSF